MRFCSDCGKAFEMLRVIVYGTLAAIIWFAGLRVGGLCLLVALIAFCLGAAEQANHRPKCSRCGSRYTFTANHPAETCTQLWVERQIAQQASSENPTWLMRANDRVLRVILWPFDVFFGAYDSAKDKWNGRR